MTTATLVSAPVQEPHAAPAAPDVIEVVVTLRHIERGRPRPTGCAVALALKELGFYDLSVGTRWIKIGQSYLDVPPEMAEWIRAFDDDKSSVAPERFLLRRAAI